MRRGGTAFEERKQFAHTKVPDLRFMAEAACDQAEVIVKFCKNAVFVSTMIASFEALSAQFHPVDKFVKYYKLLEHDATKDGYKNLKEAIEDRSIYSWKYKVWYQFIDRFYKSFFYITATIF